MASVRLQPIGSFADLGYQRNTQRGHHPLHTRAYKLANFCSFRTKNVEVEFVVHLQDHSAPQLTLSDFLVYSDHRQLDQVGSRALYRGIDGIPLCIAADDGIGTVYVPEESLATEQCGDVALSLGFGNTPIHIRFNPRVRGKVTFDQGLGFCTGDIEPFAKPESRDAVDDPEVGRFSSAAHVIRDFYKRQPVYFGGCGSVDVFSMEESLYQALVFTQMRHQPQLDLRIVCAHENTFVIVRYESSPQPPPDFGPDRNVLQIGIAAGETSRGSDGLIE